MLTRRPFLAFAALGGLAVPLLARAADVVRGAGAVGLHWRDLDRI